MVRFGDANDANVDAGGGFVGAGVVEDLLERGAVKAANVEACKPDDL